MAIGAFAAANLAGADPMKTGFEAVRFGWTVFVIPFLFVFSGTLLMDGSVSMIVIDVAAAIIGVWFGAAGVMGYSVRPLRGLVRVLYIATGLFLLTPLGTFGFGRWINLAGVALAIALVVWERTARQRANSTAAAE